MEERAKRSLRLRLLGGSIAAILVSGVVIAALAIPAEGFGIMFQSADTSESDTTPPVAIPGTRVIKCAECGVIESTREIEAPNETAAVNPSGLNAAGNRRAVVEKPVRQYEITIRLQDGSTRAITDVDPSRWRRGERVKIIAGVDQ